MSNYDTDPVKVKAAQSAINAAGYSPQLALDGKYGPLTAAGVVWFEQLHGLTVDSGIIGDQVMAATIAQIPAPVDVGDTSGSAVQDQSQPALVPPIKVITLKMKTPGSMASTAVAQSSGSPWTAVLLGLVAGAAVGSGVGVAVAALKFPIGALVGAALGALGGYVVNVETSAPAATVHGESMFGYELSEFDLGNLDELDDYSITAAEIGVPASTRSLKG